MPRISKNDGKLVYPPGVKEISEDLSTDDLVRRLHDCALAFQNMSQEEDNSPYIPLALYLATEFFIEHNSKDVRLLVACSIADVFRVYAPEAPYKEPDLLKVIFELFIQQLKGLEDTKDPLFKRYFYLLENLAWVKTFNICIELEENQKIFCHLFNVLFSVVNDNHVTKVKGFMLDLMCPLINEADTVSQELLDVILLPIIEPQKTQNRNAYALAQNILKKTSATIEPYLQNFFNSVLILGKTSQSEVAEHFYELIYELNRICPSTLCSVLPQLEFKLKSSEEKERMEVTNVLATMFADKESDLSQQNKPLWTCFLGRFHDISAHVRTLSVKRSVQFLLNHSELKEVITEQLKLRQHDPEESVRYEAVTAILSAAKKDLNCVSEELLSFVKERTRDKKFKIRKEALLGLANLYKQYSNVADVPDSTRKCLTWIKNKLLHAYYQTAIEDRLLVERILHTCLVPYQDSREDRMKKLYHMYCTLDDHAVKAINELLRCQNVVRMQVRGLLDCIHREKDNSRERLISCKVAQISKHLPDSAKAQECIVKFISISDKNIRIRNLLSALLNEKVSCSEAANNVKEILKTLGAPVQSNTVYMTMKQLLERIAPVMIDTEGIKYLIYYVKDSLIDSGLIDTQLGISNSSCRGLLLLHQLSQVCPVAFQDEEALNDLLLILQASDDEQAVDWALQILYKICANVEQTFPEFSERLIPVLENFVETGTVKQAKHAVYCINVAVSNKEVVFGAIIDVLSKHFNLESQYFRTALVSIGHIAFLCPDLFGTQLKAIVSKIVVKKLLMLDQDLPRGGDDLWSPLDSLPDETKVKIEGMKLMVRWLVGLKDSVQAAVSTLKLLGTVIMHKGDLMERQHAAPMETSWLRYTAATCMLKLCQEKNYVDAITLEQFQVLAFVMNDEVYEVREKFAQKLHKGLVALKLPLEFMAMFAICGLEKHKELKMQAKQYLITNVAKRREFLKQNPFTSVKLFTYLPDNVVPYAIHLLAHSPFLEIYDDVRSLTKVKECLWFLMEPLIVKNENYSFSFYKRLLDNIKQTKDMQNPEDESVNLKLYAVCDLALQIVISKTAGSILKDFPVEPILPKKFYTSPDKSFDNMKSYLPPELIIAPPKKSGFEIQISNGPSKGSNSSIASPGTKSDVSSQDSKVNNIANGTKSRKNSKSNHLSHFNKTIKEREVDFVESLSIVNSTEGCENKAPEDSEEASPSLQPRPRGRQQKLVQLAEGDDRDNNSSIISDSSSLSCRPRGRARKVPQRLIEDSDHESRGDSKGRHVSKTTTSRRSRKLPHLGDEMDTPENEHDVNKDDSSNFSTKPNMENPVKLSRQRRPQLVVISGNRTPDNAGKGFSEVDDSEHSSVNIHSSVPSESQTVTNEKNTQLESAKSLKNVESTQTSNPRRLSDSKIHRYFKPKRLNHSSVDSQSQSKSALEDEISTDFSETFCNNSSIQKKDSSSSRLLIQSNCDTHIELSSGLKARKTFHQKQLHLNSPGDTATHQNSSPARVSDHFFDRNPSVVLYRNAEIDSLSSRSCISETSSVGKRQKSDFEDDDSQRSQKTPRPSPSILLSPSVSLERVKSHELIRKPPEHSAIPKNMKRKLSSSPLRAPDKSFDIKKLKLSKLMNKSSSHCAIIQKLKQAPLSRVSSSSGKVLKLKSAKDTSKVPKHIKKPASKEVTSKPQAFSRSLVKGDKRKGSTALPSKGIAKTIKMKRTDSRSSPAKKLQSTKVVKTKTVVARVSSDAKTSTPTKSLQKSAHRKSVKMNTVANGVGKQTGKAKVCPSPNKKRFTAAALLAKAIKSSSLKARSPTRSPKVKQVSKGKR